MRKLVQGAIAAAAMLTGMGMIAPAPAAAQSFQVEIGPRGVQINEARRHDDRRWNGRRDQRWDDRRGGRWEREYRGRPGVGQVSRASVARCAQRYRSYDPRTHTYVINSRGDRAVCRL